MSRVIGILSDTHGSLNAQVLDVFRESGVERIIHAGDIGPRSLLAKLEAIAPVTAVLGNNDFNLRGSEIEHAESVLINGVRIRIVHQIRDAFLGENPSDVLIYGHTHKPSVTFDPYHGTLMINPGSVSRPRNSESGSIALLDVSNPDDLSAHIITLAQD